MSLILVCQLNVYTTVYRHMVSRHTQIITNFLLPCQVFGADGSSTRSGSGKVSVNDNQ